MVSAMSSAVITQTASSVVASAITGNKPNIDLGSLATNAISAGVMSYANFAFGTNALTENMNISDYAKNATINGVGQGITSQIKGQNFKDGFISGAVISVLSDSALQMRKYVKDRYDYVGDGKLSEGLRGDGAKIGGSHPKRILIANGEYDYIDISGPTGGVQKGVGTLFGFEYSKGSFIDSAIEHYAGPHDFISSWNYENINSLTYLRDNSTLTNATSGLLLIPATPFAIAPFVQDNMHNINIYKDLKKDDKQIRNEAINKAMERNK
ncbi:hypothetical protein LMG7974_01921 [Campylobacter majalis]|uniref:Filamentous hemagglutinin n=1 Tax=Campylobacter majalis TaxID=2790656 RepID=A0ABM8QA19_9BACT|nr:hypothetical protein LMG7974_01921 [Campylobacter majalis]